MKNRLPGAIACVVLMAFAGAGCDDTPEPTPVRANVTKNGYSVELLFEQDGIRIYRFYDMYEWRYFASSGQVKWTTTRDAGNGDGTTITDHHEVPTVEAR